MPTGDHKAELTTSRHRATTTIRVARRHLCLPVPGCVSAIALALAFGAATVTASLAQDVPIPRISPLKIQGENADDPAMAAPAAESEGGLNDPVDTALIPPSSGSNGPLEFLDTGKSDFDAAAAASEPLALVPLDLNAATAGDNPIDLGAVGTADPFAAQQDDGGILGTFTLDARMTPDGPPIQTGLVWRVFSTEPAGDDGKMRMVGEAEGGPVTLKLKPGEYLVHAAYGRAGLTRKIRITEVPSSETLTLNAGGIRLAALIAEDQPLPVSEVRFAIYASDEVGAAERVLVLDNAPPEKVVSLNAGIYHVVCQYGDANAVVRADIRVEPGKLTEAAVYQKAARMTLKLVEVHGGEALANTEWSVVTPAGESVIESVGAFPSVVLAAGDYTAIAKHENQIFERNFTVEAGLNRDVEVLLNAGGDTSGGG